MLRIAGVDFKKPGSDSDSAVKYAFSEVKSFFQGRPVVFFRGDHNLLASVLAAKFILEDLAPELYDCYFIVAGSVCNTLEIELKPQNVVLAGPVEWNEENVLRHIADVEVFFTVEDTTDSDISNMTPAARRIYHDLKKAIEQRQNRGAS